MNLSDFIVLAIIMVFGFIGFKIGFVLSIFKIASYFISIWISLKFYPKVADIFMETKVFENIKESILNNLLMQKGVLISQTGEQVKQAAVDTIVEKMPLPKFLKDDIVNRIPDPEKIIDINKVMEIISRELAKIIIYILSMVLLYILVRIAIVVAKYLLKGITQLPVLKQLDKLGVLHWELLKVYLPFMLFLQY